MDDLELYDLFALLHIERREELGLSLKAHQRFPELAAPDGANGTARYRALHTARRRRIRH